MAKTLVPGQLPALEVNRQKQADIEKLRAEFDQHLADLQKPDAPKRVAAAFESRGRVKKRSRAGRTY